MEITFTLVPSDMTALHRFLAKRTKTWRLSRYFLLLVVIGGFLFMAWDEVRQSHSLSSINWFPILETVVLPIIIVALFWGYFVFQARKQSQTDPLFTDPQTLSIGVSELVWQHMGAKVVRQWPSIKEIVSDDYSIYFYVGENVEHFVPKKAFPNLEAAQLFQQVAISYWKSASAQEREKSEIWPPPPRLGA